MNVNDPSLGEVHGSVDTTRKANGWRKIFSFIGPAYLVSVGYMDPGNWATDIAGGSKYGFSLIWVLLASNLMAIVLQSMSARLGIVRGRDLAQANREAYPQQIVFLLWIFAEIAIAATDLAEVLGMAIGLQLLFGLPLMAGVTITVLDTFLLLYLQKLGMRKIEAFIIVLIGIIGISFLINIILAQPSLDEIISGFIPSLPDAQQVYSTAGIHGVLPKETALYLAIGMIGATVMPHNLYLHSALIQTRKIDRSPEGIKEALRWSKIDSVVALNVAFLINAAILVLAATVFFKTGRTGIGEISEAHQLLSPLLGTELASTLFAIALIASGQSSTITGTLSGQIVMEGYLKIRINPMMRRLITRLLAVVPAMIFIAVSGDKNIDQLLIFSQVILSLQLGFAIIPLIHFVSDRSTMKEFAISKKTQWLSWGMALLLVILNFKMVADAIIGDGMKSHDGYYYYLLFLLPLLFLGLLVYITIYPWLKNKKEHASIAMHDDEEHLYDINTPAYQKIALALDFSNNDNKVIAAAIGQHGKAMQYVLIHVVETASAGIHGHLTADFETMKDKERLDGLTEQLRRKGYDVTGKLGYHHTAKEIVRIVQEENIDLLYIGAHGHKGWKDFIYGSTIDRVRHDLTIPVFIVNV